MQETQDRSLGSGRCLGEGNGYPLQCSCLENPMDRGDWQARVYGVTKSQTWLSGWHFHFQRVNILPTAAWICLDQLLCHLTTLQPFVSCCTGPDNISIEERARDNNHGEWRRRGEFRGKSSNVIGQSLQELRQAFPHILHPLSLHHSFLLSPLLRVSSYKF